MASINYYIYHLETITMGKQYIKELRKNDKFKFNKIIYTVTKKYTDDDRPLKAIDNNYREQVFHNEELEVEKL